MMNRFIRWLLFKVEFSFLEQVYIERKSIEREKEWELRDKVKQEMKEFIKSKGPSFKDQLENMYMVDLVPLGTYRPRPRYEYTLMDMRLAKPFPVKINYE